MPVRITDVKKTLAPWPISCDSSTNPLFLERPVMHVRVIDSENDSAPPPVLVSRAHYQVHEGFFGLHTAERRTVALQCELDFFSGALCP